MLYFAAHISQADAGIMVTGSHNPGDENGFKFVLGGHPFFGEALADLARPVELVRPLRVGTVQDQAGPTGLSRPVIA